MKGNTQNIWAFSELTNQKISCQLEKKTFSAKQNEKKNKPQNIFSQHLKMMLMMKRGKKSYVVSCMCVNV